MPFKPGQPRPAKGGRKKGSLNKKTHAVEEILDAVLLGKTLPEKIIELLYSGKIQAHQQIQILMDLMEYVYTKKKAVEVTADIEVNSTEIEVDQLATELVRQIKES